MASWNIRTATTSGKTKPVEEWIRSLSPEARAEVLLTVELLETHGTGIGMPQARALGNGLFELRAKVGSNVYRVIYFHWKGRTFGLLHGFTKKDQRTPKREIVIALERRAEWMRRARVRRRE